MELKKNKDLLQMAEEDIRRLEKENSVSYSTGQSAKKNTVYIRSTIVNVIRYVTFVKIL